LRTGFDPDLLLASLDVGLQLALTSAIMRRQQRAGILDQIIILLVLVFEKRKRARRGRALKLRGKKPGTW
jgi:hypothetical protein